MAVTCNILQENGSKLLQENGFRLLLENCVEVLGRPVAPRGGVMLRSGAVRREPLSVRGTARNTRRSG